jgi:hypothetical protein
MSDSQSCDFCGGEIIFRWVDGKITPIHLSGRCWGDLSEERGSRASTLWAPWRFRSFPCGSDLSCPTTCPKCGAAVYFVRHNGGSVWLDELGWPWPKHGCFDDSRPLFRIVEDWVHAERHLALVTRAAVFSRPGEDNQTWVEVCRQGGTFHRRAAGDYLDLCGELVYFERRLDQMPRPDLSPADQARNLAEFWSKPILELICAKGLRVKLLVDIYGPPIRRAAEEIARRETSRDARPLRRSSIVADQVSAGGANSALQAETHLRAAQNKVKSNELKSSIGERIALSGAAAGASVKPTKSGTAEPVPPGMVRCPQCGTSVKQERLKAHLWRAHDLP